MLFCVLINTMVIMFKSKPNFSQKTDVFTGVSEISWFHWEETEAVWYQFVCNVFVCVVKSCLFVKDNQNHCVPSLPVSIVHVCSLNIDPFKAPTIMFILQIIKMFDCFHVNSVNFVFCCRQCGS